MTMHDLNCDAFDDRLGAYLEGDLSTAEQQEVDAHLGSCVRCTALVRDLERIRANAADLPELVPSSDLWSEIARRIEAPVVPLASRPAPNVVRRRGIDRLRTAAIAAALVAVTAGVTYELTTRTARPGTTSVATNIPAATSPGTNAPSVAPGAAARETVATSRDAASAPTVPTPDQPDGTTRRVQPVLDAPGTVTSSREIDHLRTIFLRNRSQLDPRTAAIIEANLKVIDEAIAQSKAALAQDPASRFLNSQLNSALDKKLELLRTAALLPSRT